MRKGQERLLIDVMARREMVSAALARFGSNAPVEQIDADFAEEFREAFRKRFGGEPNGWSYGAARVWMRVSED